VVERFQQVISQLFQQVSNPTQRTAHRVKLLRPGMQVVCSNTTQTPTHRLLALAHLPLLPRHAKCGPDHPPCRSVLCG
jgi:hypothetical protein